MELLISYLLGLLTGAYAFNTRIRKQINLGLSKISAYLNKPEKARSKSKGKGKVKTNNEDKVYKGSEH